MRVITGTARGTALLTPDGLDTRPTTDRVKEGLFNIIQFDIPGRRVLDLFAGSGQLGIECLSRGAAHACFVDQAAAPVRIIRENLKRTRLEDRAEVHQAAYETFLRTCRQQFDLIFLDPPYRENFLENAMQIISEIDILADGGIIICEQPSDKQDLPSLSGFSRSKDHKYGKILVCTYRKNPGGSL